MTKNEFLTVLECLVLHLESKNEEQREEQREEFPAADFDAEELPF